MLKMLLVVKNEEGVTEKDIKKFVSSNINKKEDIKINNDYDIQNLDKLKLKKFQE